MPKSARKHYVTSQGGLVNRLSPYACEALGMRNAECEEEY